MKFALAIALEAVRATLQELSVIVFSQLLATLHGEVSDDSESVVEDANEALKKTRDFLEPINSTTEYLSLYSKHLAAIHIIDHLRRLIDRSQESDRAARARVESDLIPLGQELSEAIEEAVDALGSGSSNDSQLKPEEVWRKFDTDSERYRKSLIEQAADSSVDAYSTIGRLDTLRWLRRSAYHVWRITHHLRHSHLDVHDNETFVDERYHEFDD